MSLEDLQSQGRLYSWVPCTFNGVSELAQGPVLRIFLTLLPVSLLAAGGAAHFIMLNGYAYLDEIIERLPERVEIRRGVLSWPSRSPFVLTESSTFALIVNLDQTTSPGQASDFQIEWGRTHIKLRSLLGYLAFSYPKGWIISLGKSELEPRWGAWRPAAPIVGAAVTAMGLMILWAVLGGVYSLPVYIWTRCLQRRVSCMGCLKLSVVAQVPGAWFMIAGTLLYSLGFLDLIGFFAVVGVHFLLTLLFLVFTPFYLAKGTLPNPFQRNRPGADNNPFAAG